MPSDKRVFNEVKKLRIWLKERQSMWLSIGEKLTVLKKIAGGASLASIAEEYGITLDSYFYTWTYSTFTHTVL